MAEAAPRWNIWQRGLWVALLMVALFTWLGLIVLVHHFTAGSEQSRIVVAVGTSLRWSISGFAGLGIGFACAGLLHGERRHPAPERWIQLLVVATMMLAWLLWRTSVGFIATV